MSIFKFNIQWTHEIEVEAIDEDEAFEIVYGGVILDDYGKGKGYLSVELEVDDSATTEWGLFDTDPEEEDITYLSLNDAEYL
jgi:hypothetical protein